jgi:hypothetical protein
MTWICAGADNPRLRCTAPVQSTQLQPDQTQNIIQPKLPFKPTGWLVDVFELQRNQVGQRGQVCNW